MDEAAKVVLKFGKKWFFHREKLDSTGSVIIWVLNLSIQLDKFM